MRQKRLRWYVYILECVRTCNLETWINGEASRCGVHAGHVLHVVDLLQLQLASIVPEETQQHTHTHTFSLSMHSLPLPKSTGRFTDLSYFSPF